MVDIGEGVQGWGEAVAVGVSCVCFIIMLRKMLVMMYLEIIYFEAREAMLQYQCLVRYFPVALNQWQHQ